MALPAGINFRATLAYVTDTSPDVYAGDAGNPSASVYPTTYSNGITGGWEDIGGTFEIDSRNRSTTNPRLAGGQFGGLSDSEQFRFDLPAAGAYKIQLAAGDATYSTTISVLLIDSATTLLTISGGTGAANSFFDATNTVLTAANWVAGTNNRGGVRTETFASTIFRVRMSPQGINHLYVDSATAATSASSRRPLLPRTFMRSRVLRPHRVRT